MKLTWINHASYLLEVDSVRIVCDPWIEGRVFNEGWALLAESIFSYDDFENVTHIWFSHEHPDHFFPPNVKKIPESARKKITVLYQKTNDKKIVEFCEKLGFKEVIELEPREEFHLSDDVSVINAKVRNDTDSWLILKSNEGTVLNLNDCEFDSLNELHEIKSLSGPIDVLLTQFSYASWVGNRDDSESKSKAARDKLNTVIERTKFLEPKYLIPFASYVWFCDRDNFHMNEEANSIHHVYAEVGKLTPEILVMYPGENWEVGQKFDSEGALQKYKDDYKSIKDRNLTEHNEVSFEELQKASENYRSNALNRNNKTKLRSYESMKIYLSDLDLPVTFSFKEGLKKGSQTESESDISFCSQNLKYCFSFDWGSDTINVAGTFEKPENGNHQRYLEYRWIATLNNQGKRMGGIFERLIQRFR